MTALCGDTARETLILPWAAPHWHTSHSPGIFNVVDSPCFSPIGLFGTGIQSYFTFLRFLLLLNLLTMLLTACFVLLPLVWLRPPELGPALKLSECWGCPDPAGISLGMLRGLALDSARQDLLPGSLPAQPQTASALVWRQWSWKIECHMFGGTYPDALLFPLSKPPVLRQPPAPE